MGTGIEWTDEVWNPVVGCTRVSSGCKNCFAIGMAHRAMQPAHHGLTVRTARGVDWSGVVRCLPERLEQPLRWRRPRLIFVNSMSDIFHDEVPDEFLAQIFTVMTSAERHVFQVLTKRPARMAAWVHQWLAAVGRPAVPAHIWLGVSVENQHYAQERVPQLLATPATTRFLSVEPLLGPVDLRRWLGPRCPWCELHEAPEPSDDPGGHQTLRCPSCGEGSGRQDWYPPPGDRIGWVIAGGESGHRARPLHPDWLRTIRDHCLAASVPFFFKQWGTWAPLIPYLQAGGRCPVPCVEIATPGGGRRGEMVRVGVTTAGRDLDGRTWLDMPPNPTSSSRREDQ